MRALPVSTSPGPEQSEPIVLLILNGTKNRAPSPDPKRNSQHKSQFIGNSVDFLEGNTYFWEKSQHTVNIEEIGKAIRDRRKTLKVRQDEIAGLSEVGINTLVAIERGQSNPKLRTLLSILDTLGLEITVKLKD